MSMDMLYRAQRHRHMNMERRVRFVRRWLWNLRDDLGLFVWMVGAFALGVGGWWLWVLWRTK